MFYKKSYSNSGARPRRFSGSSGRSNTGGGRSRGFKSSNIDPALFVKKAVEAKNDVAYVPTLSFETLPVDKRIIDLLLKKGYTNPTPIQDKAIVPIVEGKDVVGIANTGTGKTAAFLIPLIHNLLASPNEKVLIMVPTRELATQIHTEFMSLSSGLRLHATVCVGGVYIGKQIKDLKYQTNILIGTPGRIKDLIERKALNLTSYTKLVLDEADRMLDMGFIADMRSIISKMPADHQTLFFSATLSEEIKKVIGEFLRKPEMISVKTGETSHYVDQDVVEYAHKDDKIDTLHAILLKQEVSKTIIFGKTKHGVESLRESLQMRGVEAVSLHGDKNFSKRQHALAQFKTNKVSVLVATDVAARGIDVRDISHVINYDLPATYDDYVHRIGRTGRGGDRGTALTFVEKRKSVRY